jgi:hypothetical protein
MRNYFVALFVVLLACWNVAAQATPEQGNPVVSSTSWTAAFADLAGVDDSVFLADASLRHPPEYELKPSDIVTVGKAEVFVCAGYEKMMQTISETLASSSCKVVRITTENSIEKVLSETKKIAEATGTTPRTDSYVAAVEKGRVLVQSSGLEKMKVLCHKMQLPLAKDLGLNIVGVFGPAAATSAEIADARKAGYDLVIDNVHNPVASPLVEVSGAKLVIWRNFPSSVERDALVHVVEENIKSLQDVAK